MNEDVVLEILELLIPVLSALAGGLLAFLGGLVVWRLTRAEQKRRFLLDKIEEVYREALSTENALEIEFEKSEDIWRPGYTISVDKLKGASSHIRMQLKLYFSDSTTVRDRLQKVEADFFRTGWATKKSAPEDGWKADQEIRVGLARYTSALRDVRKFLEEEMQKLMY